MTAVTSQKIIHEETLRCQRLLNAVTIWPTLEKTMLEAEMRTITWYMDEAKRRCSLRSDRALGRELGLAVRSIQVWREGISLPKDETMVRLADLAGVDRETALLELARWRAEGTTAAPVWDRILKDSGRAAAALLIALITTTGGYDLDDGNTAFAKAQDTPARNSTSAHGLYYEYH